MAQKTAITVTMEGENTQPKFFFLPFKGKRIFFETNENIEKVLGAAFDFKRKYEGDKTFNDIGKADCKIANRFKAEYGADVTPFEVLFAAYLVASLGLKKGDSDFAFAYCGNDYYECQNKESKIPEILRDYCIRFGDNATPFEVNKSISDLFKEGRMGKSDKLANEKTNSLYEILFGNLSVSQLIKFTTLKLK